MAALSVFYCFLRSVVIKKVSLLRFWERAGLQSCRLGRICRGLQPLR